MTKWIEVTGKTEDDAVANGLKTLALDRDDVSVEVVERAKSGFLGLGGSRAVVRLLYESDENESSAKAAPVAEKASSVPAVSPVVQVKSEGHPELRDFITGLLKHMDVSAEVTITERDGGVNVYLGGPGLGAIIGRRGETLDAIQHIANYAVNKGREKRLHISVDAENYRQKREDSLVKLAEKMAEKTVKYRRSMALEPMNSYERHVIHTALQDYPDVSTGSTGVEPRRRVVVSYTKGQSPSSARQKSQEWS